MSYCFNPHCENPQNSHPAETCHSCGEPLLLKERYRLLRPLGQSNGHRTFLAVDEDSPTQPHCIIGQFSPEDRAPARQVELRLSELGKNEQIPELLATFDLGGCRYWVQEYIEGYTVADDLAAGGAFTEGQVRCLLEDVLSVLQLIGDRQLVHQDLKPENLVRSRSSAKIALVDFASAKFAPPNAIATPVPLTGSAEYVAPEQALGKAVPASDLYSLGVICVRLLTQMSPFDLFDTPSDRWVWRDYLKTSISRQLGRVLDGLLQRDLQHRYRSAGDALKDLNAWTLPVPTFTISKQAEMRVRWAAIAITILGTGGLLWPQSAPVGVSNSLSQSVETSSETLVPLEMPDRLVTFRSGPVWSIAVSPDGRTLISGGADGNIQLRYLGRSGNTIKPCQRVRVLKGHEGPVWSVAVSPDGKTLASASEDKTLKLWDLRTGKVLNTLTGHGGEVLATAFSPDGEMLASVGQDRTLRLWDTSVANSAAASRPELTLHGHTGEVKTIAFAPQGDLIATGGEDGTIKLWATRTGTYLGTLSAGDRAVWSIAFSPNGRLIAASGADNTVRLWDLNTGAPVENLNGHNKFVQSVAFSPDGRTLASSDLGGTIVLHSIRPGGMEGTLKAHSGWTQLAFGPDGQMLASGSYDDTIKLWRLAELDR